VAAGSVYHVSVGASRPTSSSANLATETTATRFFSLNLSIARMRLPRRAHTRTSRLAVLELRLEREQDERNPGRGRNGHRRCRPRRRRVALLADHRHSAMEPRAGGTRWKRSAAVDMEFTKLKIIPADLGVDRSIGAYNCDQNLKPPLVPEPIPFSTLYFLRACQEISESTFERVNMGLQLHFHTICCSGDRC
jgi:hypothetical protein